MLILITDSKCAILLGNFLFSVIILSGNRAKYSSKLLIEVTTKTVIYVYIFKIELNSRSKIYIVVLTWTLRLGSIVIHVLSDWGYMYYLTVGRGVLYTVCYLSTMFVLSLCYLWFICGLTEC